MLGLSEPALIWMNMTRPCGRLLLLGGLLLITREGEDARKDQMPTSLGPCSPLAGHRVHGGFGGSISWAALRGIEGLEIAEHSLLASQPLLLRCLVVDLAVMVMVVAAPAAIEAVVEA